VLVAEKVDAKVASTKPAALEVTIGRSAMSSRRANPSGYRLVIKGYVEWDVQH
jgi:hypothetical protein